MALVLLLILGWGVALGVPAARQRLAGRGSTGSQRELSALRMASAERVADWRRAAATRRDSSAMLTGDVRSRQRAIARARGYGLAVVLLLVAAYGTPRALVSPSSSLWWLCVRFCVVAGIAVCVGLLSAEWRADLRTAAPRRPVRQPRPARQARPAREVRPARPAQVSWSRATGSRQVVAPVRPSVRVSWSRSAVPMGAGTADPVRTSRRVASSAGTRSGGTPGYIPNPAAFD